MQKWKVKFYVDGKRTETIVTAATSIDARKLIQAQYPNSKIQIISISRL